MKNLTLMTDEELVIFYLKGNTLAFNVLWLRCESDVFACIQAKVHNWDLTKDLAQDTSIKVFMGIQKGFYTEQRLFRSWVRSIANHVVFDYFRDEKRKIVFSENELRSACIDGPELAVDNIEDDLVRQQHPVDVLNLLNRLSKEQKEVMELYYYQDYSVKEIAALLAINQNTVLGRMRYGKKNILKLIADYRFRFW